MATIAEQANIFRHALHMLRSEGYLFAQVPSIAEGGLRFVARQQSSRIVIYAATPSGLLGIAHVAREEPKAWVTQGSAAGDGESGASGELSLELAGSRVESRDIREACIREVTRRGYTVSQSQDPREWCAVKDEPGSQTELVGWTPEGLLGVVLIHEEYGDLCWKDESVPDHWADIPGEGWDDEE